MKTFNVVVGGSYSNNIKYYDISQLDENQQTAILSYSILCKMIGDGVVYGVQLISPMIFYAYARDFSTLKYIAVDFSIKVSRYTSNEEGVTQQELITVSEIFNQLSTAFGIELPEITEEEFYAIPE